MALSGWTSIAEVYDPLKAGSIDSTDTEPHDRAVIRAMNAKYKANKSVDGDPRKTIFVARLNKNTEEDTLWTAFRNFGKIKKCRLVRDIVTGFSKGYGFIEFEDEFIANIASKRGNKMIIDQAEVFVDMECERTLKGWVPRRLGGGVGGNKKSGQLRFGGKDRPFIKPILPMVSRDEEQGRQEGRLEWSDRNRGRDDRDSYRERDYRRRDDRRREDRYREDDYKSRRHRERSRSPDRRRHRRERSQSPIYSDSKKRRTNDGHDDNKAESRSEHSKFHSQSDQSDGTRPKISLEGSNPDYEEGECVDY